MVININYKKLVIACIVLVAFLSLAAVSASDNQTADSLAASEDSDDLAVSENVDVVGKSNVVNTSSKCSGASVFIQNDSFRIQILDENGVGISGKKVQISCMGSELTRTTNSNGCVYLKLSSKGTYAVSWKFNENGYAPLSASKKISVVGNSTSKIKASNYVAYVGAKNTYTVTLTACGVNLPNQKVTFVLKGKKYTRTTDSKGKASLNLNLAKGKYPIRCYFGGSGKVKSNLVRANITVKQGMPTSISKATSDTYRHQKEGVFKVKYKDVRGNPISKKTIVFKINGKTYTNVTDSNGIATLHFKLAKNAYKVYVNSYNTAIYKKASNTFTIKVKSNALKNNGFWLFGADMKKVNLENVAKSGVNQIFLNAYAVELHGKAEVAKFATTAKSLGINVHIWMQTFYEGGWISPVYNNGTYKYSLFNSLIKKAKSYAAIDGVAGIHFDYLRFPGTAYKHTNGVSAINYFTKTACDALHKQNPSLILSAAVMPEPSNMKYYYGQDIATLSKYLDVIIPMAYKGNYGQGSSWIQSVTASFVKMSNGAKIWTGLQGYYSDSNVKNLPVTSLSNDADYAGFGGALGVIMFRYTLFELGSFKSL